MQCSSTSYKQTLTRQECNLATSLIPSHYPKLDLTCPENWIQILSEKPSGFQDFCFKKNGGGLVLWTGSHMGENQAVGSHSENWAENQVTLGELPNTGLKF